MIIFYVAIKFRLLLLSPQLGVHLEFIALKQTTVRVCLLNDCLINIVYMKQQKEQLTLKYLPGQQKLLMIQKGIKKLSFGYRKEH